MGGAFFKHTMWQIKKKKTTICSYCSNGFKKHLQIKERHHGSVFRFFFPLLLLKFLLGHYRVGPAMNLCDSYEVTIKIVNSA